jgi:hypothetical protein
MLSFHWTESSESHAIAARVVQELLNGGVNPIAELNLCTDSFSVMVGEQHSSGKMQNSVASHIIR